MEITRGGAQIIINEDKARFEHKSIQEYFTARVLYDLIKGYEDRNDN